MRAVSVLLDLDALRSDPVPGQEGTVTRVLHHLFLRSPKFPEVYLSFGGELPDGLDFLIRLLIPSDGLFPSGYISLILHYLN